MSSTAAGYAGVRAFAEPGPQFERILFPTDFSPTSLRALPLAAAVARTFGSELKLVHVLVPGEYIYSVPEYAVDAPDIIERHAEGHLRAMRYSSELERVKTGKAEVLLGGFERLMTEIGAGNIDLVVMSTRGSKGLGHLVLGSFVEDLTHRAPCPVLTMGPEVHLSGETEFHPKHILFATDFSPDSFRALGHALAFARRETCGLTLVHVLPKHHRLSPGANAYAAVMREGLHQALPLSVIKRCAPEIVVSIGDPVAKILEAAEERKAELIVTGARSSREKGSFSRSVSYGVIAGARCPVLTVRGRE